MQDSNAVGARDVDDPVEGPPQPDHPDPEGDSPTGFLQRHYREQIPELQEAARRMRRKARSSFGVAVLFAVFTGLAGAGVVAVRQHGSWGLAGAWALGIVAALCALIALVGFSQTLSEWSQQRDLARDLAAAQRWAGLAVQDDSSDYFDQLVAINLGNLSDYYRLVKAHAGRSFTLAAVASVCGFVLVTGALTFGLVNADARFIAYVGAAAGTVIEVVSAVFFVLYNKTVRQLKGYHDSLLQVQNVLLSLKMVESVTDDSRRSELTADVIRNLLGAVRAPSETQGIEED